jgi:FAD:protein FMN transferase
MRSVEVQSCLDGVLGTRLTLFAQVTSKRLTRESIVRTHIESLALAEIDRLEGIFSIYNPLSELRRWRATASPGTSHQVSHDLATLLRLSALWQMRSGGAYNPAIGAVFDQWKAAEATGVVPSVALTDEWATQFGPVPYEVSSNEVSSNEVSRDTVTCLGDCTGLTFNSLAKGLIADRVAQCLLNVADDTVRAIANATVNLGGDLRTINRLLRVGVEHPTRPYDNEPPVCVIELRNGGVATSGASRRPLIIGDQQFSHIIDPRTCRPVLSTDVSVTVVADDAATADVLATIVSVTGTLVPDYAIAIATATPGSTKAVLNSTPLFDQLIL